MGFWFNGCKRSRQVKLEAAIFGILDERRHRRSLVEQSDAAGAVVSKFGVVFLSGSSRCPILVLD
ncbi:unnamed protein product [Eruca vesicaria subsp. sativa]|uniref:Uncharacterized protein n=1 Tax=Eruca vesicaria subsp. sativa TaxID=29727 RepID=A0ABC8LPL0_ERUVS|nr:unnamed protein product [Eruca vesicaria subsp. sativa]